MGVMKDMSYDVEALFIDGCSPQEIATQLAIPLSLVKGFLKSFGVDVRDLEVDPWEEIEDPHVVDSTYYGA